MKSGRQFKSILATLLLLAACTITMAAQDPNESYPPSGPSATSGPGGPNAPDAAGAQAQTNTDPPGRVARIQYMAGQVSIQPGGVNDWVAADMNRPLTTSDRVWTDVNSKAELDVGGGFIRLNSEASLTLTNVSDQTVQLELDQGTLELTVRYLGPGQIYEVDTANLAFTVTKAGVYRFDAFPKEDATWVTVRKGQGEATGSGAAVKVKSGEQVRFGNGASLQHTAEAAPSPDGFDDWASVRDKRLDSSVSAQYVSPGVIGSQDLDAYGRWQTIPPYGPVWVPTSVPVGWAPYRYGHWVWIAPWGWTWVDDAPWGFAPFHYGRWVNTGGYWGWAPGPYRSWSPCYSPALVAWVGGPGFGVGFGFGGPGWGVGINFGWFALGWGEPFYPWYHGWYGHGLSSAYFRNVNVTNTHITNITNITNNYYHNNIANTHYANRTVNGAVTAAPGSAIASGRAMNHAGMAVPSSALMHASSVRTVGLTPTRASVLGGQQPRNNAVPPASATNRNAVTHATPPTMMARASAPTIGATASASAAAMNSSRTAGSNAPFAVHRPPTSTNGSSNVAGRPSPTTSASATTHNVPRPTATTQSRSSAAGTSNSNNAIGSSNAMHPSTQARTAQPSSSQVQHSTGSAVPRSEGTPGRSTPEAQPKAPANHGSAPADKEKKSGSNDRASAAVPRPPSSYSYHAAAAYSPAQYGRSGYANGATYGSGSRPYAPSSTRSYGSAPSTRSYGGNAGTYTMARNGGSAPRYSAPSGSYGGGGHYSAPSSGGHYSAPSSAGHGGGGSSHASHGGGGHSR
jgi:hypothetical protein